MKNYDVMYGIFGESENIDSGFSTLKAANCAAESLAETIVEYGKHSKIKRTYDVYVEETVRDENGDWVSSNCPAGGFYKQVVGII